MNPWHARVAARAKHRCEYCRAPESLFNFPFEVEHIIPASKEGVDRASNFALACRSCNCFKGDRITFPDPTTGIDTPLYNPRAQDWSDHFEFAVESAEIRGRSATGRATVEALAMNGPRQKSARTQWIKAGRFP